MIETRFKQTEIGLIPEDWEVTPLNTLGNVKMCKRIMKHQTSEVGDIPFYKIGTFGKAPDAFIPRELFEQYKSKYSYPNKGTVLISAAGTIGRTVVFDGKDSYFQDSNIVWIDNDESMVLDKYLYYYFNVIKWQTENGGIVTRLYNDNLKSTFFAYPKDKKEQQRIAEALSNIDKLISSLSKTIEKKRLIKLGAMQQLLTGMKRLPGFEGEWGISPLNQIAKMNSGGTPLSSEPSYYNGKIHFLSISDITNSGRFIYNTQKRISHKGLEASSARMFPANTLLYAMYASIGKVAISKIDIAISQAVLGFILSSDMDLYFLYYLLDYMQEDIVRNGQTGTQTNLSKKIVENINIYYPINVKEQTAIAEVLTTMDNEIESLEEEREKYIRLKEGMMQKLLTGQIRLVEAETKQQDLPKTKAANVYFKRSVLAAEIADRLCEERTFGHVKMEKLFFLTEHLCHIDIDSHYHRDAAGPYDNRALRSIDSQLKKQKWFEAKKMDKGYRYIPMQNRGGHKKYFDKYYADVMPMFEKIIDTFKSSPTEQCEIVATIYSAWDDLLQSHRPFTDDDILNEVLNNWHESKKRISRNRWQTELDWMRSNGFVPQENN